MIPRSRRRHTLTLAHKHANIYHIHSHTFSSQIYVQHSCCRLALCYWMAFIRRVALRNGAFLLADASIVGGDYWRATGARACVYRLLRTPQPHYIFLPQHTCHTDTYLRRRRRLCMALSLCGSVVMRPVSMNTDICSASDWHQYKSAAALLHSMNCLRVCLFTHVLATTTQIT